MPVGWRTSAWVAAFLGAVAAYFWLPWPDNWPETIALMLALACAAVMDAATR